MESRKKDHIVLAFESQTGLDQQDTRFEYEPMISSHPAQVSQSINFLDKTLKAPIWISSMTGGTKMANTINKNLARACNEFGLGMGLGSCRIILDDNTYFDDFNLRDILGYDRPFYANLGIAQIEKALKQKKIEVVNELILKLQADGLIIHVNPLQEWLQPEGDKFEHPPIETIAEFLELFNGKVIVKEVGQGFGPQSMAKLLQLPLAAIDFAAYGGTNFAKIELQRSGDLEKEVFEPLSKIGHSAIQMVENVNNIVASTKVRCPQVIISGGLKNFLDGYYLIKKIKLPAIYGQASGLLKYAVENYDSLRKYLSRQIEGFALAMAYLKVV